jgi:hypothetical protein
LIFSKWDFPWYYFPSFLAGECLLFYIAGFIGTIFACFLTITPSKCPFCKKPLMQNGSYFSNHEKPNWKDALLCIIYVILNFIVWIKLV